jgi:LPXTG-motif cell wall-anchored protein
MNVIHWVIKNSTWIFSGVGVALLSALWFLLKRKREAPNVSEKNANTQIVVGGAMSGNSVIIGDNNAVDQEGTKKP